LEEGKLTVILTGEIDHHMAKSYITAIGGKIEAYRPRVCILDFSEVGFMDSSGIAVVINTLRLMKKIAGTLQLSGLHQQPWKVMKAAGIDKLVRITEEIK